MAFESLKSFGRAAATATKAAAVAVADVTVKTYNDLQAVPESIKCSGPGCQLQVAVPPNIFDWSCSTAACEAKVIRHDRSKKVCDVCNQPKPTQHDRTVVCSGCGHPTVVPGSNAAKHVKGAGQAVKGVAVAAKDGAVSTYNEMKATPTTIACSGCATQLEVPTTLFDWTCEKADCLKQNGASLATCEQCGTTKPKSASVERAVTCQVCQSKTVVPSSNARKGINNAARATKEFARNVSTSTKSAYNHAKSSPVQFNCSCCTSLLQVPGYWVCKGCQSQNPREPQVEGGDAAKEAKDGAAAAAAPATAPTGSSSEGVTASADAKRNDDKAAAAAAEKAAHHCPVCGFERDEVEMVQCGTCRQPTPVPRSNFGNSLKKTTTDLSRSISKLWYDVSSTPYINCDQCKATIKVPAPAPAAVGGAALARPESAAASGAAPGSSASSSGAAPSSAPAAGTPVQVICPSCNKTFTATVGAAPGTGAAAPGGAPVPAATQAPVR